MHTSSIAWALRRTVEQAGRQAMGMHSSTAWHKGNGSQLRLATASGDDSLDSNLMLKVNTQPA